VEQQPAAGLGERQIAEFVEDDEVHPGQVIGEPALPGVSSLGFKPTDEVDDVVEAAAGAGPDAAEGSGDGKMRLAGLELHSPFRCLHLIQINRQPLIRHNVLGRNVRLFRGDER
jgi:hypothetical protein